MALKRYHIGIALLCTWACAVSLVLAQSGSSVTNSKHNLSSSGPGPIKVAGESEVCKFCHTPHASNPIAPLWNRDDPGTYYQTYKSTTLVANVGQPTGSSRLCLSCHDGTIALTQTYNSRNSPSGSIYISAQDRGYIGTDLSDDHPISFVYSSSLATMQGELADPSSLPDELPLDHESRLQCTTCHDPHDDQFGNFLNMDNSEARMCRTCHTINGWLASSHASASASLGGSGRDDWDNLSASTVRQASCEACHRPHTAGGRQRLLRFEAEEDNCLSCHDGSVANKNVAAAFNSFSKHPIAMATGVHDPTEDYTSMSEHVECADCHNPHTARSGSNATAPNIQESMIGASGVASFGGQAVEATFEYQVCYKCHSGSSTVRNALVQRVFINTDTADEFSPNNPSYHPVEVRGRNSDVPSLIQSLRETSIIYCTDCHGSNNAAVAGPHGSTYEPLLVRDYRTNDNTAESPAVYALCYECHERSSIVQNDSFERHEEHIVDEQAPCSACHDPHGVSASVSGGTNSGTHLINFDSQIVKLSPSAQTGPSFQDNGAQRGSCTLLCHDKDHDGASYGG